MFHEKADGAIKRLQELGISGLLRKHHYNVSDRSVMNYASYALYLETIEDALNKEIEITMTPKQKEIVDRMKAFWLREITFGKKNK